MIATYAASFRFFRVPGEGEVASQPWLLRPCAGIWLFQLAFTLVSGSRSKLLRGPARDAHSRA